MKVGLQFFGEIKNQLDSIDLHVIVLKAANITNKYSPGVWDDEVNIYFLYGIRGTVIVYKNEMGIDICAEVLNDDGTINENELISLISHELHHVAFDGYINKIKDKEGSNINE